MKSSSETPSMAYRVARADSAWLRWARKLKRFLPRACRPHRIWSGPLKGRIIVTSWRDYPAAILGLTERPLLDWFGKNVGSGETWLDVGAHYGYTALSLSELVGSRGRVFAFEPMLPTAGLLVRTRELNAHQQLTVVPLGLDASPVLASHSIRTIRGMVDSTLTADAKESVWLQTMFSVSLDSLWPLVNGGDRRVHGVKIDVQGMELSTLRGMLGLLRENRPKIIVEFHTGVDRSELLALLRALDYGVPGIPVEPVEGEDSPRYLDDRSYAFLPNQ
jgi:FkbM family methyltransferase